MTRGTFILINPDSVLESQEFNGDMYPEGHGKEAMELLNGVTNIETFVDMVQKFNNKHHRYKGTLVVDKPYTYHKVKNKRGFFTNKSNLVNMSPYFDDFRFFSDYLFIRNLSGRNVEIFTCNRKHHILENNSSICLYFGQNVVDFE